MSASPVPNLKGAARRDVPVCGLAAAVTPSAAKDRVSRDARGFGAPTRLVTIAGVAAYISARGEP